MLRSMIIAGLLTVPIYAHADEGMSVVQDFGTSWQTAYNNGDAKGLANLYVPDAVFSSGVLGNLKGQDEIVAAVTKQMQQMPKITITPVEGHQSGDVVWGFGDFAFPDGPTGHYGITVIKDADAWHIAMHVSNATPKK